LLTPRPKSHIGVRELRLSAPAWPAVRPDCTKLLRALEDACTAIVWRDDSQIVEQIMTKCYADATDATPGAPIEVASSPDDARRRYRGG
jgi:Holliday junction resolvase RusA-like endonuclease